MLRKGADFDVDEMRYNALETVKKELLEATEITLGAGFVLMVEDYVTGKQSKKRKSMLPFIFDHNFSQQHS